MLPQDPGLFLLVAYLVVGFVLLAKGANWLVGGGSQIARRMGISVLVVGLTVVAFGTSLPEVVVSSVAAGRGDVSMALGNVLGSNIANIGLVLGTCAIVLPPVLQSKLAPREVIWLFASLASLWWVCSDHSLTRIDAGILLALFAGYNAHVFLTARRGVQVAVDELEERVEEVEAQGMKFPALWLVLGIVSISLGAYLAVLGGKAGAVRLNIPESVVGLTVLAVGTSLPELAAGLGGAFKGETDISIGNVVGSNVFNLMAAIGVVGLIQPLDPSLFGAEKAAKLDTAFAQALHEDFWVVLAFSLAALLLPFIAHGRAGRTKGIFLVLGWVAYTLWLVGSRTEVLDSLGLS